jgi:cytochrome c-type biogenesis protein CcmH
MRKFAWPAVFTLLVLTLIVGFWPAEHAPRDNDQRIAHLAEQVRCPTCAGLSVAQSNAPLAVSAKDEIAQQVSAGRSDQQIRDYFVSRYGDSALMTPSKHGAAGAVWLLPVVLGVVLLAGATVALRRWRAARPDRKTPSDDDRQLVADALAGRS